ncbi:ATP-binding cassette domain-containing protein [Salicibibacter halophilus]|uniref:ATP-binding cassette domain-containing protein n=1 Tax=Salicibibacter halophilus TaxID=2502791 RepID=A0A514LJB1_9BACI|nr:ATP-binding cassette domain-containing protein [Salicibibacter halophilus]QDI91615.1 ATP-binding cassette domain-containing protein [Salicibibacter halophilus]
MVTLQKSHDSNGGSGEVVMQANNLGVSFQSGHKDDYKSHIFNMFTKNKSETEKSKTVWPLRNLDFTGYQGEILGIIGSNGAGKTTLCKMISGILHPDEGGIHVDGKVTALFSMGMGFNKELTGRENAYLNGMMLGVTKKKVREFIDQIQEFAGLDAFMDQPMKTYSSGMKARLGFSVAAHLEPEILILDEALNTGDTAFGDKAAGKMQELVQKAKMVILVTHSIKFATKNCDRLMWIDKGVVKSIGDPDEVAEEYLATIPEKGQKRRRKLELKKTEADVKEKPVLQAENIGLYYPMKRDKFWALQDVNFTINEGEIVGIIGHNGAGKSTICKVLTNIIKPDKGSFDMEGETTALLNYGTGFNDQLTGTDNVYLNGMFMGLPKTYLHKKYPEIVRFSELDKFMERPIKYYSSGMRARLGFSIAATLQPDIFIIDEALSTGDIAFQQKASEKIQDMMESAKAVIIVSHSMSFVEKVCTRAIWMEQGTVKFDGEAQEAVNRYKTQIKGKVGKKVRGKKRKQESASK